MRWLAVLASALLLVPAGANGQIPEQAGVSHEEPEPPREPPKISSVRYVEDYSYLRDPANRTGAWWESVKFIPLTPQGALYLTVGDELRLRPELLVHNNFELGPRPVDPYLRFRELPYGDLHLGEHARVFLQFQNTYAARSHLTKSAFIDQSNTEVLQGFVDGKVTVGGDHELLLRAGRLSMVYGAQRLVSTGPNVRYSFEGALARWQHERWRLDTFFVWPIKTHFGSFNDDIDLTRRLWSVYLIRKLPGFGPTATLEVYYFGYTNQQATYNDGSGFERRTTFGSRFAGGPPGGWQWDLEAIQQFGSLGTSGISAWTIASAHRYTFQKWPLKPMFELRANAISGDARVGDDRLNTFNPLFTTAEYFGDVAMIGPANLFNMRGTLTLDLGRGFAADGVVEPYWRESSGDALYNPKLGIIRPSDETDEHYVGTQFEAQIAWVANRNLSSRLEYTAIVPGSFVSATGPALTVHYFLLEFDYKY